MSSATNEDNRMARRTHRRLKHYGTSVPPRVRVLRRFLEDEIGDEEREDVIGQPLETEAK